MAWGKIDDKLHSHPKFLECADAAQALWLRALSWCCDHLTDGAVPEAALPALRGKKKDAAELVRVGLWDATTDGWQFHDWAEYQPTAEKVNASRASTAKRVSEWRKRSVRDRGSGRFTVIDGNADGVSDAPM